MTLTLARLPRAIQCLGLLGALSGVALTALAPSCQSGTWIQLGLVVAAFDVAAIVVADRRLVLGLAVVGSIAAVASVSVVAMCRYVETPTPIVPTELGALVLIGSSVPRLLGAGFHWFGR